MIKRKLFFLLVLIMPLFSNLNAQPGFSKGYFIDTTNKRIECLICIKPGALCNPTFTYKINFDPTIYKGTIASVKEYGIYNYSSFIRATIPVDRSSKDKKNLSTNKNPEFETETQFLKVLVNGIVNLYYFEDKTLHLFFYSLNDSIIRPLIYKLYIDPELGSKKIANAYYLNQLYKELNCNNYQENYFNNIDYDMTDLVAYFKAENNCRMKDDTISLITNKTGFKQGYFIDNNDKHTECIILQNQGPTNPLYFYYLTHWSSKLTKAEMESVKEFEIYGVGHFVRAKVYVDRSSQDTDPERLSISKEPELSLETHFLKVLVDGYAKLYYLENKNNYRFFYSVGDSSIQQLIYKQYIGYSVDNRYFVSAEYFASEAFNRPYNNFEKIVLTNDYFHQQLFNDVNYDNLPIGKITPIGYNYAELMQYFTKENRCIDLSNLK